MTETVASTATRHVPADLPNHLQHYVGGAFVDSLDGDTFDVLDPVSNETYVTAAAGKKADVDLAVAAARTAFAENFRFFADLVVAQADDTYKVPGRQINYVNRKPIGVAGLITPWNTPFMLESWKLGPALAMGNTVVLKPAEFTPLSASLWAGIFEEAGLPEGVFNLVNGLGEDAGDALVKHPDVPLISFTAESSTGQLIFGNVAPFLKGLSMELGGKSPAIVSSHWPWTQ